MTDAYTCPTCGERKAVPSLVPDSAWRQKGKTARRKGPEMTVEETKFEELHQRNQVEELDVYQALAAKTAIYRKEYTPKITALSYVILGLTGEAGEIANKFKKVIRDDGGDLSDTARQNLIDELGDVLWYVASVATELGTFLSDVATDNIEKLSNRKQKNTLGGSGDGR